MKLGDILQRIERITQPYRSVHREVTLENTQKARTKRLSESTRVEKIHIPEYRSQQLKSWSSLIGLPFKTALHIHMFRNPVAVGKNIAKASTT